jgi:hypothetical protein
MEMLFAADMASLILRYGIWPRHLCHYRKFNELSQRGSKRTHQFSLASFALVLCDFWNLRKLTTCVSCPTIVRFPEHSLWSFGVATMVKDIPCNFRWKHAMIWIYVFHCKVRPVKYNCPCTLLSRELSGEDLCGSGCINSQFLNLGYVTSGRCTLGEIPSGSHWIRGYVGPTSRLDKMEIWTFFVLAGYEVNVQREGLYLLWRSWTSSTQIILQRNDSTYFCYSPLVAEGLNNCVASYRPVVLVSSATILYGPPSSNYKYCQIFKSLFYN